MIAAAAEQRLGDLLAREPRAAVVVETALLCCHHGPPAIDVDQTPLELGPRVAVICMLYLRSLLW